MATAPRPQLQEEVFIVFDLETTGLEPAEGHEIIEIGAIPIIASEVREDCAFHSLVDPGRPIPAESSQVHGLTDDSVRGCPRIDVVLPEFLRYCGTHPFIAHNAEFDVGFVNATCARLGLEPPQNRVHDTKFMSRQLHRGERRHSLDDVCRRLSIETGRRHRSLDDVTYTAQAFLELRRRLRERGDWRD